MAADGRPGLHLVPPSEPSAADKVRLRIKAMPRPDGMLQCNRCGGHSVLSIEACVIIKDGRRRRGTRIEKDVCAHCWKGGIVVPMLPAVKGV